MPAGAMGQMQNMKSMMGALTNKGNADVEGYYTGVLSRFIADDLQAIPSR